MKEILLKFESDVDYEVFIKDVIEPEVAENKAEYDALNGIVIIKQYE